MAKPRYIVEGTWSGYHASQRHVCHRTVTRSPDLYKNIHTVIFTDNTYMSISLRKCKPREKVNEIHGYDQLFNKIIGKELSGTIRIADL